MRPPPSRQFRVYLQWDSHRFRLIDVFWENATNSSLETRMAPLLAIANTNRSTWRYPNTAEGAECECGHRPKRASDMLSDNRHRLACYIGRRSVRQSEQMLSDLRAAYDSCPWCPALLSSFGLDRAAKHFTRHLSRDSQRCPRADYESIILSGELEQHILRNHAIPTLGTLLEIRYCYECRYFCNNTLE